MNEYRVLDLFSGIGGFSLGLERAGMQTVAFCECDGYARQVLKKHWPTAWLYEDVRTLTAKRLRADGIRPNIICGGFPCQDISTAGKGAGIEGTRSGLWSEIVRLVCEVRPRYVIVENVSALRSRGLDRVLGDLAAIRYDAEWHCIPASAVGAPHQRDRVWIVAYAKSKHRRDIGANAAHGIAGSGRNVADESSKTVADPKSKCRSWKQGYFTKCRQWHTEPDVGRVAYGIPARVDRLRCLGNAIVPQIAELIGRAIIDNDNGGTHGD